MDEWRHPSRIGTSLELPHVHQPPLVAVMSAGSRTPNPEQELPVLGGRHPPRGRVRQCLTGFSPLLLRPLLQQNAMRLTPALALLRRYHAAILRLLLSNVADQVVFPYGVTVAQFVQARVHTFAPGFAPAAPLI